MPTGWHKYANRAPRRCRWVPTGPNTADIGRTNRAVAQQMVICIAVFRTTVSQGTQEICNTRAFGLWKCPTGLWDTRRYKNNPYKSSWLTARSAESWNELVWTHDTCSVRFFHFLRGCFLKKQGSNNTFHIVFQGIIAQLSSCVKRSSAINCHRHDSSHATVTYRIHGFIKPCLSVALFYNIVLVMTFNFSHKVLDWCVTIHQNQNSRSLAGI